METPLFQNCNGHECVSGAEDDSAVCKLQEFRGKLNTQMHYS